MKKAVYAGSFDPITMGHFDVVRRASKMFDKVIVAVGSNSSKRYTFSAALREHFAAECIRGIPGAEAMFFSGLLINFMKNIGADVIIRGLRFVSDFESELQIASLNRYLNEQIETVFIMPTEKYSTVSSSSIRELLLHGIKPEDLIHPAIIDEVIEKYESNR